MFKYEPLKNHYVALSPFIAARSIQRVLSDHFSSLKCAHNCEPRDPVIKPRAGAIVYIFLVSFVTKLLNVLKRIFYVVIYIRKCG